MKLVWFPLAVMFFIGVLGSMMQYSEWQTTGQVDTYGNVGNPNGFVDESGRLIMYENLTLAENVTEPGEIRKSPGGVWMWSNSTGDYDIVSYHEQQQLGGESAGLIPDLVYNIFNTNQGIIALVAGMVIVAIAIGIRVLNTGTSSFSVGFAVFGIGLGALWTFMSVAGQPLIDSIPFVGGFLYFGLTLMYAIGIFQMSSSAGGGD